ncbi:MAG: BatA domain-containing protein, partial [Phycisphaerales bacterium]|nr:BatA domain-containing protein [Phycisphaerales bacterium]
MTFLAPTLALAGVLAMAVPIVIHLLFRRRRKPVEWAAMRQLLEAIRRTSRRLRLEQWLLLAVRCAMLLLLGLALAQPLLRAAGVLGGGVPRAVFLVLDDSVASSARGSDGVTALARAVEQATSVVRSLEVSDAVGVIATARPARGLVVPPSTDHSSIIRLLESLTPQQTPADLPAALGELRTAIDRLGPSHRVAAYLLSDFRAGTAALDTPLPAVLSTLRQDDVRLLASPPATEPVGNVQVVAIDPLRSLLLPGQADGSGQVTVRLARGGDRLDPAVSRVRLEGSDIQPVAPRVVEWEAGQVSGSVVFTVVPVRKDRASVGLVARVDEDGQPGDDARFGVVESRTEVRVALLDRRTFGVEAAVDRLTAGQWMSRALRPYEGSPMEVTTIDPNALDDRDLRGVDAVLLPRPDLLADVGWAALRRFVDRGGVLVVSPPSELNVHLWIDRFLGALDLPWTIGIEPVASEQGERLAEQQPTSELLRLVAGELPQLVRPIEVFRWLPIDRRGTQASTLLVLANGTPLAIAGAPKSNETAGASGLVVFLATAPDLAWTNLPAKPFMVPFMQELVRQGVSLSVAAQQTLAGDRPVLPTAVAEVQLLEVAEASPVGVDASHRPAQPLQRAGLYELFDP